MKNRISPVLFHVQFLHREVSTIITRFSFACFGKVEHILTFQSFPCDVINTKTQKERANNFLTALFLLILRRECEEKKVPPLECGFFFLDWNFFEQL